MKETFESVCKAMGGKYSSEVGLLEPDVGYETLHEKMAHKQWCSLGHLKGLPDDFNVFRAPGVVEFQSKMFQPTESPTFQEHFKDEFNLKEKRMCFRSTIPEFSDSLEGINKMCVATYPEKNPHSGWIGFPRWGTLSEGTIKHLMDLKQIGKR